MTLCVKNRLNAKKKIKLFVQTKKEVSKKHLYPCPVRNCSDKKKRATTRKQLPAGDDTGVSVNQLNHSIRLIKVQTKGKEHPFQID